MLSPLPSIVRLVPEVMAGRVLPRVIVPAPPVTLKLMVTGPVVAVGQSKSVSSIPGLSALRIASRRVQNPLPEVLTGSVVFFTVIVLVLACSSDWITMAHTGASTMSRATSNPGRTIALEALRLQPTADDEARAKHLAGISVLSLRFQLLYRCHGLPVQGFRPVSVHGFSSGAGRGRFRVSRPRNARKCHFSDRLRRHFSLPPGCCRRRVI
jgi:hypothetical protein